MQINHTRIDDRLVHGQIVAAWLNDSQADTILVADNKAAGDKMQQTLLKLAVPSRIKLIVETIDGASKLINDPSSKGKALLILRNPETAYSLLEKGVSLDTINVGNISNSKSVVGRTKILQNIFVEPNDVEYLKKIASKGVRLDVRAVPNDKSIDGMELLSKHNL